MRVVKDFSVDGGECGITSRIPRISAASAVPSKGSLIFDTTSNTFLYGNGSTWISPAANALPLITLTLSDLNINYILNNLLNPGTFYQITGCDVNLFNDGTETGSTYILQAISTNQLAPDGIGFFWVPKYATYQVFNRMLSYGQNSRVSWGGYTWFTPVIAAVNPIDALTLPSPWVKDAYSTTYYTQVAHEITYDIPTDRTTRRYDPINNNLIIFALSDLGLWNGNPGYGNPIQVFQWGNNWNSAIPRGIGNVTVRSSYFNLINFPYLSGCTINNCTLINNVTWLNVTWSLTWTGSVPNNPVDAAIQFQDCIFDNVFVQGSTFGNISVSSSTFRYNATIKFGDTSINTTGGLTIYDAQIDGGLIQLPQSGTGPDNCQIYNLRSIRSTFMPSMTFQNMFLTDIDLINNSTFQPSGTGGNVSFVSLLSSTSQIGMSQGCTILNCQLVNTPHFSVSMTPAASPFAPALIRACVVTGSRLTINMTAGGLLQNSTFQNFTSIGSGMWTLDNNQTVSDLYAKDATLTSNPIPTIAGASNGTQLIYKSPNINWYSAYSDVGGGATNITQLN